MGTSLDKVALAEYSALLEDKVHPEIVVLILQVGITMLSIKETGAAKMDIIVGEVH